MNLNSKYCTLRHRFWICYIKPNSYGAETGSGGVHSGLLWSTVSEFLMNCSWKIPIQNNGKQQIQTSILIVNCVNRKKGNPRIRGFNMCHILLHLHINRYLKRHYLVTGAAHRSASTSQSTCPTSNPAKHELQEDSGFRHFAEASCRICDGEVR